MKMMNLNKNILKQEERRKYVAPRCLAIAMLIPQEVICYSAVAEGTNQGNGSDDGENFGQLGGSDYHTNIWEDENDFDGMF